MEGRIAAGDPDQRDLCGEMVTSITQSIFIAFMSTPPEMKEDVKEYKLTKGRVEWTCFWGLLNSGPFFRLGSLRSHEMAF